MRVDTQWWPSTYPTCITVHYSAFACVVFCGLFRCVRGESGEERKWRGECEGECGMVNGREERRLELKESKFECCNCTDSIRFSWLLSPWFHFLIIKTQTYWQTENSPGYSFRHMATREWVVSTSHLRRFSSVSVRAYPPQNSKDGWRKDGVIAWSSARERGRWWEWRIRKKYDIGEFVEWLTEYWGCPN